MSWDSYITNLTANDGVEKASIHGFDGNVWATSPDLKISPEEAKIFLQDEATVRAKGVYLEGKKYMLLRIEDDDKDHFRTFHLKCLKKEEGDIAFFATVCKTKQAIEIVRGTKDAQGGQVSAPACKMASYLCCSGY